MLLQLLLLLLLLIGCCCFLVDFHVGSRHRSGLGPPPPRCRAKGPRRVPRYSTQRVITSKVTSVGGPERHDSASLRVTTAPYVMSARASGDVGAWSSGCVAATASEHFPCTRHLAHNESILLRQVHSTHSGTAFVEEPSLHAGRGRLGDACRGSLRRILIHRRRCQPHAWHNCGRRLGAMAIPLAGCLQLIRLRPSAVADNSAATQPAV